MAIEDIERHTPAAVRRLLREFGGVTPTGKPMWRLVRAGDCRILCQGRIHHFPRGVEQGFGARDGHGDLLDRGGSTRPDRIQGGVFWMPRYRDIAGEWWILQKWFPPHVWGSAVDWNAARTTEETDTALFAQEFPHAGDYFMLAGPWPTVDAAGDLRAPIRMYLRALSENPRDLEAHVQGEIAVEAAERRERLEALERTAMLAQSALMETWKSTSGDAQRVREQLAAGAGLKGHFGASEAWG